MLGGIFHKPRNNHGKSVTIALDSEKVNDAIHKNKYQM